MTTRMATGQAKASEGKEAVRLAVDKAREKLGHGEADLVILYCSSNYDYQEVLNAARGLLGDIPLIGSSTAGEFVESGVEFGSVAVSLISSDEMQFFTGLARDIDRDVDSAVGGIISNIPVEIPGYPYRCLFLLTDGMVGNGEEITLLISNMVGPDTQVVGGLAADDFKMQHTVVFHNDEVASKAASICMMASKKPFYTSVDHGHSPLSEPMQITRAEKNVLYEIRGRPAWDVWKEQTAEAAKQWSTDVHNLKETGDVATYFANFELGLHVGRDKYKVRYPTSINEDGSINFTCTIPNNSRICIMDGRDEQKQVDASRRSAQAVKQAAAADGYTDFSGALVIECAVRGLVLGDNFYKAHEAIQDELGSLPLIGAECYGEIRLEPGQFSGYHNTTTVILLMVQ